MIEFYSVKHSYYDEYKSCCVHNCVRQILEYYGFEDASLLINSNYSFDVKIELNERDIKIWREPSNILTGNLNHYLCAVDMNRLSVEKITERDQLLLKENIPIAVDVDIFYLPYDVHYKKSNCLHTIVYCGSEDNRCYLVDIGERTQFCGTISYSEYMNARLSENPECRNLYSGQPVLFRELYISRDIIDAANYRESFTENLTNIERYYDKLDVLLDLKDFFSFSCNIKSKISQEQLSQIYYPLYSINRKRKLFKHQLSILMRKGIDTNGLCDEFDEVLKKWEYILLLLLKMKYIEENYRSCKKIAAYIEQIYFMEFKLHEKISILKEKLNS